MRNLLVTREGVEAEDVEGKGEEGRGGGKSNCDYG